MSGGIEQTAKPLEKHIFKVNRQMFVPSVSFLIYDAYSNQVPGTRTHESGGLNCILSQGHTHAKHCILGIPVM